MEGEHEVGGPSTVNKLEDGMSPDVGVLREGSMKGVDCDVQSHNPGTLPLTDSKCYDKRCVNGGGCLEIDSDDDELMMVEAAVINPQDDMCTDGVMGNQDETPTPTHDDMYGGGVVPGVHGGVHGDVLNDVWSVDEYK